MLIRFRLHPPSSSVGVLKSFRVFSFSWGNSNELMKFNHAPTVVDLEYEGAGELGAFCTG